MANVRCGNSIYVDSTGLVTASTDKNVKVAYIIYTGALAADAITFKDTGTSGSLKMTLKSAVAADSTVFDFSLRPLVFPGGIYVSAISANSTATIIITTGGGD